jgi:hypothetical protein
MLKKVLLLMVMMVSVGIFAPVSAQVLPEKFSTLVDAARFFPSSTPFYFSIRTDAGYIDTLNDVFVQVQERVTGSAFELPVALDMVFTEMGSADFETGVRPWLGDYLAIGMFPPDSMIDYTYSNDSVQYGLLIRITDRVAATEFVRNWLNNGNMGTWLEEAGDDFTAFRSDETYNDVVYVISDNHISITNHPALMPPTSLRGSLLNTYAFEDALNAMPADAYNFVAYLDVPTIQSYVSASNQYARSSERLYNALLSQMMGPITVAGKIEEGRVLIVDTVISAGNMIGMEQLGMTMPPVIALNPEFVANIPSDSIFALHGTSPLQYSEYYRDTLLAMWRYLSASELNPEYDAKIQEMVAQGYVALGRIADAFVSNIFGLSLEQDFANWMSSDYVWFMRSNPELDNPNFPIDTAVVFQVADGAQSVESMRRLVRALPISLRALGVRGVTFVESEIEGADALFINIYGYAIEDKPILELVISANETVFTFGTVRAVTDVLRGGRGGGFVQAQPYILPNATMVLYDNMVNALPLARWGLSQGSDTSSREITERIVNMLGEGVISAITLEDGTVIVRSAQVLNLGR